jgi:hypothetical protein
MKQHQLARTTAWLLTICLILLVVVAQEDVHPDVVAVLDVAGGLRPKPRWASSYSDGENCYCLPFLDGTIGNFVVETELGWLTTQEVCDLLGPGPGRRGRPVYNDIQCGNGPPNDDENEFLCPGRTDVSDCKRIECCSLVRANYFSIARLGLTRYSSIRLEKKAVVI